jgi:hypothetical protein
MKTRIFYFDEFRGLAEDLRKRFDDSSKYDFSYFQDRGEFLLHLAREEGHGSCRVAIVGIQDPGENYEMIYELTMELKKGYPGTGIILICPAEKIEEIMKQVRFNIDAYIPRNSNSVLRIHNAVKKVSIENNINIFRKRRNSSFTILIIFFLLAIIILILVYLKFPGYI